jgi:hypothetical protein
LRREQLVVSERVKWFWILNRRNLRARLHRLDALCQLRNKRILELGCSVNHDIVIGELIDRYEAKSYTGLNIHEFSYTYDAPNVELIQQDVRRANFKPGSFDVVFSIAFGEHTPDPGNLFPRVRDWLVQPGYHYGWFQLWSSAKGHHIFEPLLADKVPDFGHLHLSPDEMQAHLERRGVDRAAAAKAVDRIYRDPYINRIGVKDYIRIIESSGMDIILLDGRANGTLHPMAKEVAPLTLGQYTPEELSFAGLEFLLRKSEVHYARVRAAITFGMRP